MENTFPIIEVPDDASEQSEYLGTKPKFWYGAPDGHSYLFKEARSGTGEDWSEKIACELCELLNIPHAHYELAIWKDKKGIVTRDCRPENSGALTHGNEILHLQDDTYPMDSPSNHKVHCRVPEHTLNKVLGAITTMSTRPPLNEESPSDISTAAEVFVGYLMLDAWIGNGDRHHQNWAIIAYESKWYLAPTFDHASCLGRNESDKRRKERLTTNDKSFTVKAYLDKSISAFYNEEGDPKPMKTLDAFRYVAIRYPEAAKIWLDHLEHISTNDITDLFQRIPQERISRVAVEFALKMLEINKSRLLSIRSELR